MNHQHFLLLSLPAQGHINPTLQLAKILARNGARVTFATTVFGLHRMKTLPTYQGLSYTSFSDGHDDEASSANFDSIKYMADLKRFGSQNLSSLLRTLSDEGQPVTFVIYTVLLPWAATVAREMHVPSALLFIQSATSFAIFHHFFNSHDGITTNIDPSSISITFPGLPLFSCNDIPTFLSPKNQYHAPMVPAFQEHIQVLEQDPKPCVLVNTFDAFEREQLKAIANINLIAIGPLIPSAFSDGNDLTDKSFGCDLFESNKDYIDWLDSREDHSVVYVSFGSLVQLQKEQKEEMLNGLIESGRPFLFVIRSSPNSEEAITMVENGLIENGLIVPWCAQLEVLSHKSVGCFVTHCGWNSTMESIVSGVPIVGCPHFSDQPTNAKLVEEVWRNGVRAAGNEERVVKRKEIKRCLDIVMGDGEEGELIRKNALKWRNLAVGTVKEGGSSYNNLKMLLESL